MIAQSVMRAFHRLVVLLRSLREISREARPAALARQMIPDVAYGLRLFRKAQAFSATCVLIVALGIAATTAIFSVVHGVALRPLPYRDPDRFGEVALVRAIANFNLTGYGEPERLFAARVSASTFRVLGVAPAIGRTFADDENQIGRDRVVLLSDGLWRRRFGAERAIVGRAITLSGVAHTVVGVMKPDFPYPGPDTQVWTPLTVNPDEPTRKSPGND
jgi:hypothetical protein